MRRIAVGDVMTRNFIHVTPKSSLHECAKKIVRNGLNTLPVINSNKLVGLITSRDILWAITKKPNINLKKIMAMEIAKRKVAVIKPSLEISQAIQKMRTYNFRTLPVLSKGKIIGIVNLRDILKIEPELYPEIGELYQIKEEERKLKQTNEEWPLEGFCDNCGAFNELLKVYDQLLCPDCREELF
jgi:CBS domain-containing protein